MNGDMINYTFYTENLQKTTQDVFRAEKVLKAEDNKLFVRCIGCLDSSYSWIYKSAITG